MPVMTAVKPRESDEEAQGTGAPYVQVDLFKGAYKLARARVHLQHRPDQARGGAEQVDARIGPPALVGYVRKFQVGGAPGLPAPCARRGDPVICEEGSRALLPAACSVSFSYIAKTLGQTPHVMRPASGWRQGKT